MSNDITNVKVYEKEEFVIRSKVLEFDKYVRQHIISIIPSKDRDIRIHFLDELYNVVKNLHYAVYTKGNIRVKYLTELIVNISLLDYLFNFVIGYSNSNNLKVHNALNKLLDVRNMIKKWKLTEESKKTENK